MKRTLLALTVLAGAVVGAQAGLILSDDFNYPDGGLVGAPGSVWVNNSGGGSGNLLLVSNQTLIVTTSRTEDAYRFLNGTPYLTNGPVTSLYAHFKIKCIGLPTATGTYFTHFGGTNVYTSTANTLTGHRARVYASLTNNNGSLASGTQFYLGIVNASGLPTNGMWGAALTTNVTYDIVTRYTLLTGSSTLWVNPANSNETDTSVTAMDVLPAENPALPPTNGIINIAAYDFRQATGEGSFLVNDLKVSTNFNDLYFAPNISSIADQSIPANSSTPVLDFQVGSPVAAATSLYITTNSSNPTLVPNNSANIVVTTDVTGTNRTIQITPAAGQQGSTIITVGVIDPVKNSSSYVTFKVTVGAPSLSTIPNQIALTNTSIPAISFTVSDPENDATTVWVASSSNTNLLTTNNIILGSSGGTSNVTLTPVAGKLGVTTLTLNVADAHNTNSTSFTLTMRPELGVLLSEDFTYTANAFTEPDKISLYGATGSPWVHVSGPSYEITVTNGAILIGTNNEDLGDALSGAPYHGSNGVVFYTSFTVNFSYLPSVGGDYFFSLKQSDTDTINFRYKVFSQRANAAVGKFRLAVANYANAPVQLDRDLSSNVLYEVVGRYNSGTGESVLWVNPLSEQSAGAVATDQPGSADIGGVALRQPGSYIGDLVLGRLRVGTTFAEVFTPPPAQTLHFQPTNGTVILSWSSPLYSLLSAPAVTGPWSQVYTTSPYTNTVSGTTFFRLAY